MKRLFLLFVAAACICGGAWAANHSDHSSERGWTKLSAGASDFESVIKASHDKLCISGALSEAELSLLKEVNSPIVCLNDVTLSDYSRISFEGNTVIESVVLPSAMASEEPTIFVDKTSEADLSTDADGDKYANSRMFRNCTNLKAAAACNGTDLLAYVNKAGELFNSMQNNGMTIIPNVNGGTTKNIKISGNLNNNDLRQKFIDKDVDMSPDVLDLSCALFKNCEDLKMGQPSGKNLNDKIKALKLPEIQVHATGDYIPENAFIGFNQITKIVIPDHYTRIDGKAFYQCSKLEQVDFGENSTAITNIGTEAFRQCESLQYVYFANLTNELSFGDYAFYECRKITHITIPEKTIAIGNYSFYDLENLEAVRMPSTLLTIGNEAFSQCHKIESIVIPENVISIGDGAFRQCTGLRHVYLRTPADKPLPTIYPATELNGGQAAGGTFEGINLFNCGGGPSGMPENGTETTGQHKASVTWEEGCQKYIDGGGATVLHFIERETEILDTDTEAEKAAKKAADKAYNNERFGINISDTYYYTTTDGYTLPKHEVASGEYGNDYKKRLGAAFTDATVEGNYNQCRITQDGKYKKEIAEYGPTAAGWKQFILMKGTSPTKKDEIYTKEYDDTWYTMCFPFDLTPKQLEAAFGASYEICEFTGVEVVDDGAEGKKALILHFMDVAQQDKTSGVMAHAAHPYMIHPNTKVGVGGKVKCDFVNVKYTTYKPITKEQAKAAVPTSGGKATLTGDGVTEHNGGAKNVTHYVTWEATKGFKNDQQENTGNRRGTESYSSGAAYTFVGSFEEDKENVLIPYGAYFLGCEKDKDDANGFPYPKYYRETAPDNRTSGGVWRQYTAIIIPNEQAVANIENGVSASGTKGFDLGFNEYETDIQYESTTGIKDVLDEAAQKGQAVEYVDVIYNINGQVVKKGTSDLKNLPKGLYIVNGKKYFVK
ncbi:MAG: leucine-rich repeat domain-containing protein [Prevotella sp.]|nr:leucine-rich repeat domain-containing protein [Prevotella sp.]